jgi:hypothetical protein
MNTTEQGLRKKAFDQGYMAGRRDLPISDIDWEREYLSYYKRGYAAARVDARTAAEQAVRS